MLQQLLRKIIGEPKEKLYAEDIINKGKDDVAATLCLTQDDIYNSIYNETKDLFHDSIKSSSLNREQILYIKYSLRDFLGPNMKYYCRHYKNDAHEIYSLLKSPFLDNGNYNYIISMIQRFIQ